MSLPSACNRCFPVQTCSPVEDLSIWVLLSWELWLGVYSVFVCFFSLLVMLSSEIQKIPRNPLVRGFPDVGNFSSFTTPFPGWVSIPNSFVSHFVFYILSCLLLKKMGCLSGCLVSCTRVQKLLCGNCSEFKWSFDEFVGEKVVSPSYSSTILGLPPSNPLPLASFIFYVLDILCCDVLLVPKHRSLISFYILHFFLIVKAKRKLMVKRGSTSKHPTFP